MTTDDYMPDWFSADDPHWFNEGTHYHICRRPGAHLASHSGAADKHLGGEETTLLPRHNRPCSLNFTLPPLSAVFFKPERSQ